MKLEDSFIEVALKINTISCYPGLISIPTDILEKSEATVTMLFVKAVVVVSF